MAQKMTVALKKPPPRDRRFGQQAFVFLRVVRVLKGEPQRHGLGRGVQEGTATAKLVKVEAKTNALRDCSFFVGDPLGT